MRFAPLALAVVCALVLFTGLGAVGFLDQREARDAEVARELVRSRETMTPLYGNEPHFEKPILGYGPELISSYLPGSAETRSRVVRAVLALLLVAWTASVGAGHFGARAGWWSGLVLATTLALPLAARTDGTQLAATLLGWVGCAGLADAVFGRLDGRGARLVVAYGALAVTAILAGPLPALWPLGALALYLALAPVPHGWRRVQVWAGLVLLLGLAIPWYGAMTRQHGLPFLAHAAFFPYAFETRGSWVSGFGFMVGFLAVGFFPWSALLSGSILHAATRFRAPRGVAGAGSQTDAPAPPQSEREHRESAAAHFFVASLLAGLVPIIFYPGPPLPACLPALPAAAILCGRYLDHLFEDERRNGAPLARAVLLLALLGSVGALLPTVLAQRIGVAAAELRLLATVVFVTSWLPFLAHFMRRKRLAAWLMLLPAAAGIPVAMTRLVPAMEGTLSARLVAEAMNLAAPERAELLTLEPAPPSLRYYLRRPLALGQPLDDALTAHRAPDGLAYVAFRPSRERDVARAAAEPLEILLRTPSLVLARTPIPRAPER